ncbi:peptide/nickel transport system permease protein [Atopostipes suicloacalis DSM 15692]|uniref:Peptide/nickel transport system permease protein n=1 Tax=Atopostipes suicloacalis DSM 15692 TaxID=1121025 RepID=A0A1M4VPA1_9LACT|nr:ABC transporter permease [Atopostipes suicloacalis]SHE70612.1 peptide/nickel transport system permease protein [Atopostipes suicloacalis DSM 15692]
MLLTSKKKINQAEEEMLNVPQGSWAEIWYELKRNRRAMFGLFFILFLTIMAIFADQIAPYGMREQNLSNALQFPNTTHWLGTDDLGRDILSRMIYGTRVSLTVGVSAVAVSLIIGGILGVVAGYYKGWIDTLIMRFCDILLSIPSILLAIAIVASLGSNLQNLIIAIGISSIPVFARIIRSGVISVKEQEYIEASEALGANDIRIIFKHILPNILSPIIVQSSMGIASAILSAVGLGFIGLGLEASIAEWGTMLNAGRGYIRTHYYLTLYPGLLIMLTVLSFNLLGDGLRDAIDPKMRER